MLRCFFHWSGAQGETSAPATHLVTAPEGLAVASLERSCSRVLRSTNNGTKVDIRLSRNCSAALWTERSISSWLKRPPNSDLRWAMTGLRAPSESPLGTSPLPETWCAFDWPPNRGASSPSLLLTHHRDCRRTESVGQTETLHFLRFPAYDARWLSVLGPPYRPAVADRGQNGGNLVVGQYPSPIPPPSPPPPLPTLALVGLTPPSTEAMPLPGA